MMISAGWHSRAKHSPARHSPARHSAGRLDRSRFSRAHRTAGPRRSSGFHRPRLELAVAHARFFVSTPCGRRLRRSPWSTQDGDAGNSHVVRASSTATPRAVPTACTSSSTGLAFRLLTALSEPLTVRALEPRVGAPFTRGRWMEQPARGLACPSSPVAAGLWKTCGKLVASVRGNAARRDRHGAHARRVSVADVGCQAAYPNGQTPPVGSAGQLPRPAAVPAQPAPPSGNSRGGFGDPDPSSSFHGTARPAPTQRAQTI